MTAPVRLRGEVGERRRPDTDGKRTSIDRRRYKSVRAAELAAEIERLRGFIAALEENNARYREVIGKAAEVVARRELERTGEAEAMLAKGQPEGCHE